MELALRNLLSMTATFKRGTVVGCISAANKVPPKLTPRIATKAFPVNKHSGALPGVEVKTERKPMNLDRP